MIIRTPGLYLTIVLLVITADALYSQTQLQSSGWYINQTIPAFTLDKNSGERTVTLEINFQNQFEIKPNIFLSVTQLDASKETNLRYKAEALSITREGFTLKISTWSDTKIFSLSGYWLAYSD